MFSSNQSQVSSAANWIEECFSTYLYTGNGSTQTITNGIDLSTKGGLVWSKRRVDTINHLLADTVRGRLKTLSSNTTNAESTAPSNNISSFNTNGYTVQDGWDDYNVSTKTYVSWTFRKQAKFFDVVTFTTGTSGSVSFNHSIGSTPGCVLIKLTSTTGSWFVWHRSLNQTDDYLNLDSTAAKQTSAGLWTVNSSSVSIAASRITGSSGVTGVAYLFAHDAGGFGATGSDNVISCGSVVGVSGDTTANIGYEPQWLLIKNRTSASDWWIVDTMRGLSVPSTNAKLLVANKIDAEAALGLYLTSTGFTSPNLTAGETYIYIAIRRGPMKTPTSGTSVFSPVARTGTGSVANVSVGFAPDFLTTFYRTIAGQDHVVFDRLRGPTQYLNTAATTLQIDVGTNGLISFNNTSFTTNANGYANNSGSSFSNWVFGRAPGFFDVVCYTGTGSNTTFTHNLSVVPEMMIVKRRDTSGGWRVYVTAVGNTGGLLLNTTDSTITSSTFWNNTTPTASVFTVGTNADVNASGGTYVAYLFASVTGVSKVGSYTGNGSNQTINCGFTAGARFILIKRYDSTGDWYVWDTARGIVAGNDPRLSLNSTAAEVTTDDSIDPDNSGFIVNQLAATNINVNAASYIFLAVS